MEGGHCTFAAAIFQENRILEVSPDPSGFVPPGKPLSQGCRCPPSLGSLCSPQLQRQCRSAPAREPVWKALRSVAWLVRVSRGDSVCDSLSSRGLTVGALIISFLTRFSSVARPLRTLFAGQTGCESAAVSLRIALWDAQSGEGLALGLGARVQSLAEVKLSDLGD